MNRAAKSVTMIPPTIQHPRFSTLSTRGRRRVAGYARVSTDSDEQHESYEAQVDYYTHYIQENPEWEFVGVYTDEAVTGTNTKKRDGFNRMIKDALDGMIDLIVIKSVSRFARNTVDALVTIRKLKEKGVEVYFQKENIYTLDSKGELLITIMSSLAQEEARSISENVTWGQRKRMKDGKVSMPYGRFLGYQKGPDGTPEIVKSEARTVELIYGLFLKGYTFNMIATHLMQRGILSPARKQTWRVSTVESILRNEKYKGEAILQKKFTVDFLTKKQKVNEGEVPQYYVTGSHPAIIEPDLFDLVQRELQRRKESGVSQSGVYPFSSKVRCAACGGMYGSKVWHSKSKYRRVVFQCNRKYRDNKGCDTPHLYESQLRQAFVDAIDQLWTDKAALIEDIALMMDTFTDTTALDAEREALIRECDVVHELTRQCVEENARTATDQAAFHARYSALLARYDAAQDRLAQIKEEVRTRAQKRSALSVFLKEMDAHNTLPGYFDESLWCATAESMTVNTDGTVSVMFRSGHVVTVAVKPK